MLTKKILEEASRISEKRKKAKGMAGEEALLKVLELFEFLEVQEVYIGKNIEGTLECKISFTELTCFLGFDELSETPELRKKVKKIEQMYMYDFEEMKAYVFSIARKLDELGFNVKPLSFSDAISITLRV